jgi:hypothetical protein
VGQTHFLTRSSSLGEDSDKTKKQLQNQNHVGKK